MTTDDQGADHSAPEGDAPWATAVVVAYNSANCLADCLTSLAENELPAIVVDNASADDSADIARSLGEQVIRSERNLGYGRGNNLGAAQVASPWFLIVNPDVQLEPGCAKALRAAAERYSGAALLAPRLVEPNGRVFFQPRSLLAPYLTNPNGKRSEPGGDCCAPFLSGAALLVRKDVFDALGGFDPNIFLFYEDDDLCRRVADAGYSLVHVNDAVARHGRGGSSGENAGSSGRARFHQAWSRDYVSRKYGLPRDTSTVLAVNALKWLGAALAFNRRRMARYGGSVAGAFAALTRQSATRHENLPDQPLAGSKAGVPPS